ncbi:hypothetical protein IWX91DRAFT_387798 [Phyllosticta citricarpa]
MPLLCPMAPTLLPVQWLQLTASGPMEETTPGPLRQSPTLSAALPSHLFRSTSVPERSAKRPLMRWRCRRAWTSLGRSRSSTSCAPSRDNEVSDLPLRAMPLLAFTDPLLLCPCILAQPGDREPAHDACFTATIEPPELGLIRNKGHLRLLELGILEPEDEGKSDWACWWES